MCEHEFYTAIRIMAPLKNVLSLRTVQTYLSLCGRACHFAETPAGFDIIFPITVGCWMSFVKLKAKKLISLVEYELKCLPMKQVNIKSSSTYHYIIPIIRFRCL